MNFAVLVDPSCAGLDIRAHGAGFALQPPAGGAWSTVLDMARYLMLELGKGRMPDGTRIISEDALLERRKKGVKIDTNSSFGQFDEWGSWLRFEAEPGGDRLIRLLNPPWRGGLKLLIDPENDGGQSKYVFHKQG
jgi:CubicO group peptidase (beta-lactamase class C family)